MAGLDGHPRPAPDARRLLRAWPLLVVVVAALAAAGPLVGGRMVLGHDALEHPMRTAEYARLLAAGVPWPQWSPNLGHGYGEPIFLFNPPLFYALASVPTLAGLPVVSAVNLTCVGLLIAAGLGTYACTAPALGRAGGLVAGVAYAWAPYVLLDLYVRQALTELTAVCILPWALAGLDQAVRAPGGRRVAGAALGVSALLLSSTPATVVTAPALLGQIAASGWGYGRAGWVRGLAALALGGLLASAFWVPAVVERHLLRFDRLLTGWTGLRQPLLGAVATGQLHLGLRDVPGRARTIGWALASERPSSSCRLSRSSCCSPGGRADCPT